MNEIDFVIYIFIVIVFGVIQIIYVIVIDGSGCEFVMVLVMVIFEFIFDVNFILLISECEVLGGMIDFMVYNS